MTVEKKLTIELTDEEKETLTNAAIILKNLYSTLYETNCYEIEIKKEAKLNIKEIDTARYVTYTLGDYLIKWTATN